MRMIREAWGKIDRESGGIHPLAHHSMDVAAVFARIMELPVIRNRLDTAAGVGLTDADCQRLSAMAFLHDIGKLHPGFQAKGWPTELWRGPVRGHLKEGWAFLTLAWKWPDHPFHETMQRIMGWGVAVGPLFAAMIAHHGRPVDQPSDPTLNDWPCLPHYDWREEARVIDDALHCWFAGVFESGGEPLPDRPRFHHAVAGLVALADWIGSDRRFFDFTAPFHSAYGDIAHTAAPLALATIGVDPGELAVCPAPGFEELTGFAAPNPAQAAIRDVGAEARLVILEAETGSGKTEAALWRFTQLYARGAVSGLYFAVPTRAAAGQLHGRVDKALRRVFGKQAPEAVLAIPGMLRAGEFKGQRLPHWLVRWDDDEISAPKRWAAEHATRFLAAAVAIGTVDQAMLAGLQVKHAHMRGAALSRSLLVIDEVHASDTYMTEILKQLLDGHLEAGGYAMLMSATLGARARVRWTEEIMPSVEEAIAAPYPAVWVAGENKPCAAMDSGQPKTVYLETVSTMEPGETAKRAVAAAAQGARVLVIRNTVSKAVATWHAVQEVKAGPLLMQAAEGPALHHGRFAVEDRALLDREVERALTKNPLRKRQGQIVIGTQTLEQSLDIDADLLIADLCPMDVLLQRIGRLHRHTLPRPAGFESARTLVLLPEDGLDRLTSPDFENGLGGWNADGGFNGIYRDLAGLELTRRLIVGHPVWQIPEMNRELVEGAAHPDCISALLEEKGEAWDRYDRIDGGARAAEGMIAKLNVLKRTDPFDDSLRFPDSDEKIMTRLGEEGVVLLLDPPPEGPFGYPITRITLPARWSHGIAKDGQVAIERNGEYLILSIAKWHFRYSREGLARITAVEK